MSTPDLEISLDVDNADRQFDLTKLIWHYSCFKYGHIRKKVKKKKNQDKKYLYFVSYFNSTMKDAHVLYHAFLGKSYVEGLSSIYSQVSKTCKIFI